MGKIIVKGDIPNSMKAEIIAEEVLGLARPAYKLRQVCRVLDFGTAITGKWPIATKLAGQEKVPPKVEAQLSAEAYTDLDFDLWKNVVHVAIEIESELKSKFDLMKLNVEDAARDLSRMENKQIAEIMTGMTEVTKTGNEWDHGTPGNPIHDIMKCVKAIQDLGYEPDYIVMDTATYVAFAQNDKVVTAFERGITIRGVIPSIVGLNIVVDPALTNKECNVLDSKAPSLAFADGPSVVTKPPTGVSFMDEYAIAKFLEPKIGLADAGRKLTSCAL